MGNFLSIEKRLEDGACRFVSEYRDDSHLLPREAVGQEEPFVLAVAKEGDEPSFRENPQMKLG